ncbi:MAG: aminopeptidase [Bacilli bacterium]|nr:aminopeptidase [Bacilli bacterium]
MEEKYIDLLLQRCLNFDNSKILFINYDVVNKGFVDKVIKRAKELGVEEIVLDESDINVTRDKLLNESDEKIKNDPYFDKSNWDVYAKKHASFMMLDTEFPNALDDIDSDKIALASKIRRESRPVFRRMETTYEIPWVIAALPNEKWAEDIYGKDSYEKLESAIYKMCMVDTNNPIESWNNYVKELKKKSDYLNGLNIQKIHYTNDLGTDLTLTMPKDNIWTSVADDIDHNMLVNMPSYEVFTSPDYRYSEGIVYSSKPLMYGGGIVDEFYLKFKDGKVIDYDAKRGKDILKGIIESDSNSCYLGECALVDYDSPISNTGKVFKTTLIDENAACHLALGDGFSTTIPNGEKMKKEELLEKGINQSFNHVDFMIGTKDLKIEAETNNGNVIIFENGNFVM